MENYTELSSVPLNVDDISLALQRFNWPDYLVFVLMLVSCVCIGIYFGYQDHQKHKNRKNARRGSEALDYLVGGRKMKIFPVSMSLVASWISGISLLGTSTEIYVYGTQYCFIFIAIIIMGFIMYYIYLPVFHDLQITSTYEYLETRFDKRMRLFGSILFTVGVVLHLPIVIYVPALAFNQVTGINIHIITPIVCVVCIFYTSVGGLKAVVWTDVIQTIIMTGSLLLVMFKGTYDVGGFSVVWQRNYDSGRIENVNFDLDPTVRHTFWTLAIGGSVFWTNTNAINQNMVQRYLALPSLKAARTALIIFAVGVFLILTICCYNGMLIYAKYYDCDPLTTKLAKAKDQLVPLLVMDILGGYPGLSGLFVAGVFSAALSSLSTGLNSLSAIVLEDFYKPFAKKPLTEKQTSYVMRGAVLFFGVLAVSLVVVIEKMGTVLQLSMSLSSITLGPLLGLFTMGILIPWVNATGALFGGFSGLFVMAYISFRAQTSIALGEMVFSQKPVSVEGCLYEFANVTQSKLIDYDEMDKSLHHISYLYYTLVGTVVSCVVGVIVSLGTGTLDPRDIDPMLLAPPMRRFIKFRKDIKHESVTHGFQMEDNQIK